MDDLRYVGLSDLLMETETVGCPVIGSTTTLSLRPVASLRSFSSLDSICDRAEKMAAIKSFSSRVP
jgi:hypothetical protein